MYFHQKSTAAGGGGAAAKGTQAAQKKTAVKKDVNKATKDGKTKESKGGQPAADKTVEEMQSQPAAEGTVERAPSKDAEGFKGEIHKEAKGKALQTAKPAAPPKKPKKVIRIDISINPKSADALDDKYTLMSAADGGKAYKQTKTVKDDKVPGDKLVTLEFTDAPENLSYSLEMDLGKEGAKYFEFKNVPFNILAG